MIKETKEFCMEEWNRHMMLMVKFMKEGNDGAASLVYHELNGYTLGLFYANVITDEEYTKLNDNAGIAYYGGDWK